MEVLVLKHLTQHDDQPVEGPAGSPPCRINAHAAVKVVDVGMPDRRQPFHAWPALRVLVVQVDFNLMVLGVFWVSWRSTSMCFYT